MKIGIFGGSFNPVHNGHLHLAQSVLDGMGLDKIIFVPSKISPHKSNDEYLSGEQRLEMLQLATSCNNSFEVSDYELKQERTSYSVYTVRHFRQKYPDAKLYLLIGSDMLLSFESWYCFEEIMSNAVLVTVSRNIGDISQLEKKAKELSIYGDVIISNADAFPVSSTEIRKKIRKKEKYSCYLNESVVQYIRLRGLYSEV